MQLAIYVDVKHGTDIKTRRSISGFIASLNNTGIEYRAKFQPIMSTKSTKVE